MNAANDRPAEGDPTHSGTFSEAYNRLHLPRYEWLLDLIARYADCPEPLILDVGRSHLTELLHERFRGQVDSLGFAPDRRESFGRHYSFDLNDAQHRDRWRTDLPEYDIVVMAEVIEHLHTSPTLVLGFLTTLMRPGGVLVIQTPNAVALRKRVELLMGRNPYELIREDWTNPGHFREYTARELERFGRTLGLQVEECVHAVYMDYRYRRETSGSRLALHVTGALANGVYRIVPRALKPNLTVVFRRPAE